MPNPVRKTAKGRPVYTVFVKLWGDDVSGNISKAWNKHDNWCMMHVGLPKKLQQQEYFVHFLSTSPHAASLEQARTIVEMINSTLEGYEAYDTQLDTEVLFRVKVVMVVADNPMGSDIASHLGLKANFYCRRCYAGGTKEFKMSEEGYPSLFKVSLT